MKKFLNNPWIAATLALVAAVSVGMLVWSDGTPESSAVTASFAVNGVPPTEPKPVSSDDAAPQPGNELLALTGMPARRDPFAPAGRTATALAALEKARPDLLDSVHLSAVWSQDGVDYAVINGRIVQPGQAIGRLTVESVTTDGVWLVHWKGRDHLKLGHDFTLRTPAAGPPILASSL